MTKSNDYDWLNDPFDEKKAAQEQLGAATSGTTKLAIGCGCLVAVIIIAVLVFLISKTALELFAA